MTNLINRHFLQLDTNRRINSFDFSLNSSGIYVIARAAKDPLIICCEGDGFGSDNFEKIFNDIRSNGIKPSHWGNGGYKFRASKGSLNELLTLKPYNTCDFPIGLVITHMEDIEEDSERTELYLPKYEISDEREPA